LTGELNKLFDLTVFILEAYFLDNDSLFEILQSEDGRSFRRGFRTFLRYAFQSVLYLGSLRTVQIRDLVDTINPELISLLEQSDDPRRHLEDVVSKASDTLSSLDSGGMIRPGIINMEKLSIFLGRLFSFYAGYGSFFDEEGFAAWLDACAVPSFGMTWLEAAELPGSRNRITCQEELSDLSMAYQRAFDRDPLATSRLDDVVGQYRPTFVSVGVLNGEASAIWHEERENYYAGMLNVSLEDVDFDDVKVGYWGNEQDMAIVEENLPDILGDNPLALRLLNLGTTTWNVALSASMGEPGLSAGIPIATGDVSVGGWIDAVGIVPIAALNKSKTITLVSQTNGSIFFPVLVSLLFNANETDIRSTQTLDEGSGYILSLEAATGVWCGSYILESKKDLPLLFLDGYTASLQTSDPEWLNGTYKNVSVDLGLLGCSPGALDVSGGLV